MAGTLRLSNTGTGNGQSTITTAASGDTTYTLPSGGGTFVTTSSTQALTVPFASGTVSAPSITFLGDSNTGLYSPAADTVAFTEGGVESLRIDSSGNVGIGTQSAQQLLHVNSSGSNGGQLQITNASTGAASTDGLLVGYNTSNDVIFNNQEATLTKFFTSGLERAAIDSSGRLLVGTSSAAQYNHYTNEIRYQQAGLNGAGASAQFAAFEDGLGRAALLLSKSRGASVGTNTVVQSGDTLGEFIFIGADGTNYTRGAEISCQSRRHPWR